MLPNRGQSLLDRALGAAITIVVVVLLLSWAWSFLKPLLPILGIGTALFVVGRIWLNRWRF